MHQVYAGYKFSRKCFVDLPFDKLGSSNARLLCYKVKNISGGAKKIVIDFQDGTYVIDSFYDWADVYAKINVNETETVLPAHSDPSKLKLIAPGFGIRYYNLVQTLAHAVSNLLFIKRSHAGICVSAKEFLKDYVLTWYRRRPYKEYHLNTITERANYVFFVSTLWGHKNCIEHTNPLRALFMRTCRKLGVEFDGGFYISRSGNSAATDGYEDLLLHERVNLKNYIVKTRKSMFVYNVPSCWNCHGWKLGEFLAMGKAIISAPLYNKLPGNGGEIMLVVDSEKELADAIELLAKDTEIRKRLETSASTYYKKYVSPKAVIEILDGHLGEII